MPVLLHGDDFYAIAGLNMAVSLPSVKRSYVYILSLDERGSTQMLYHCLRGQYISFAPGWHLLRHPTDKIFQYEDTKTSFLNSRILILSD